MKQEPRLDKTKHSTTTTPSLSPKSKHPDFHLNNYQGQLVRCYLVLRERFRSEPYGLKHKVILKLSLRLLSTMSCRRMEKGILDPHILNLLNPTGYVMQQQV